MRKLWPFLLIYILTTADMLFTYIGLQQGIIKEANPLMDFLFNHWPQFTVILVLVAIGLILYFFYRVSERVKWLMQTLNFLVIFKFFILLLHSYWIILI